MTDDRLDSTGKVAIVTGASAGLSVLGSSFFAGREPELSFANTDVLGLS
ncbi:MAG: hypothetical protein ABI345_14820 [Jatrophihabitans sp.]